MKWFRRREIRRQLAAFETIGDEMVRVYLRGRVNQRAAVSFTGYPRLWGATVTLVGTDGLARGVVPLRQVAAVERVKATTPPVEQPRAPKATAPRDTAKPATLRAELELDISPALRQVQVVKEALDEALHRPRETKS